ncbi:hypothetical protein [Carboxylicivirga sp. RSCT41]|uniref:hypothetical protein n=1 Tax=Carboxylicivirga agarovorans TaxID=3417570 RepID=UPI003D343B0F
MWKELLITIIYWTLATTLTVSLRFVGVEVFYELRQDIPLRLIFWSTIISGVVIGVFLGLLELLLKKTKRKKHRSFGMEVASRTLLYTVLFVIITFIASWVSSDSLEVALFFTSSAFNLINFTMFVIAAFLFHFFQTNQHKVWSRHNAQIPDRQIFQSKRRRQDLYVSGLKIINRLS